MLGSKGSDYQVALCVWEGVSIQTSIVTSECYRIDSLRLSMGITLVHVNESHVICLKKPVPLAPPFHW